MSLSTLDHGFKGFQLQQQALANPKERLPLIASAAALQMNPERRISAREKLGVANGPAQLIRVVNCQVIQQLSTDHVIKMQYTCKRQTGQSSSLYICGLPPEIGASQPRGAMPLGVLSAWSLIEKVMQTLIKRNAACQVARILCELHLVVVPAPQVRPH
ncbi:hypothetical protein D9M71_709390 [compost metagenome]